MAWRGAGATLVMPTGMVMEVEVEVEVRRRRGLPWDALAASSAVTLTEA